MIGFLHDPRAVWHCITHGSICFLHYSASANTAFTIFILGAFMEKNAFLCSTYLIRIPGHDITNAPMPQLTYSSTIARNNLLQTSRGSTANRILGYDSSSKHRRCPENTAIPILARSATTEGLREDAPTRPLLILVITKRSRNGMALRSKPEFLSSHR